MAPEGAPVGEDHVHSLSHMNSGFAHTASLSPGQPAWRQIPPPPPPRLHCMGQGSGMEAAGSPPLPGRAVV